MSNPLPARRPDDAVRLRARARFVSLSLFLIPASSACAQAPALGLHAGSDFTLTQYDAFGAWLGRDVMYRVVFLDKRSWSEMSNAAVLSVSKEWVNSRPGRVEVLSVPLLPDGEAGQFSAIINGSRDSVFQSIATRISNAAIADRVIIRLGWEGNGHWYPWSYQQDPAGFKAAFRRVVGLMRTIAPGLRFEFNISNLAKRINNGARWTDGYPGDDVVDVISSDVYDHFTTWSDMMGGEAGLYEVREFAKARQKPEAFTEWACAVTTNGNGDNGGFIRAMSAWMAARPGKVLYQAYWNSTEGAGALIFGASQAMVSSASSEYVRLFGPNAAPTISPCADFRLPANGTTGPIAFTVGDTQTPVEHLTVVANSSNPALVPLSSIALGGRGAGRTVTITPQPDTGGWSTIWLKVSDGDLNSVTSFVVNVSPPPPNTRPTISSVPGQVLPLNRATKPLPFTIGDAETAPAALTITSNSSNPAVVPPGNIVISGTDAARTVTVTPVSNRTGWSTVWLKVSDGKLTQETSFVVQVSAALAGRDVGTTQLPGSTQVRGDVVTVQASGYDIYQKRDEFHFAHTSLPGDVEMTVRVTSLTNTDPWAKAGLMLRSSLADNSAYAAVLVTPQNGLVLQWRAQDAASAATAITLPRAAPVWLRLTRVQTSIVAFCSSDGVAWDFVEAVDLALPASAYGGLALVSHRPHTLATAIFDRFSID